MFVWTTCSRSETLSLVGSVDLGEGWKRRDKNEGWDKRCDAQLSYICKACVIQGARIRYSTNGASGVSGFFASPQLMRVQLQCASALCPIFVPGIGAAQRSGANSQSNRGHERFCERYHASEQGFLPVLRHALPLRTFRHEAPLGALFWACMMDALPNNWAVSQRLSYLLRIRVDVDINPYSSAEHIVAWMSPKVALRSEGRLSRTSQADRENSLSHLLTQGESQLLPHSGWQAGGLRFLVVFRTHFAVDALGFMSIVLAAVFPDRSGSVK